MVDFLGREKGGKLEKVYLFFLNIQSLRCHHDLLKVELDRLKNAPALINLCETWLTDNDPIGLYSIDGYQTIITKSRVGKKGGGIACFVKNGSTASSKSFDNDIENVMITVENDHSKKHFCVLCKAPSMNQGILLLNLDSLVHSVSQIKKEIIFCGDLNVDILVNSSFLVYYKNLLLSFGLKLLNEGPTRETTHSSSCIDKVYANMHHEVSTLKCTISDHNALLVKTDLERHFDINTPRKYRDWRRLRHVKFFFYSIIAYQKLLKDWILFL